MKLNIKDLVDLTALVDDLPIALQTASQMLSMKPQEMLELVKEEISGNSKNQINATKTTIVNTCKSQALAHCYAANSAEHLATLMEMVSLTIKIKVMNATMRSVVAIRIPEVDEMMEWAQEKVDSI